MRVNDPADAISCVFVIVIEIVATKGSLALDCYENRFDHCVIYVLCSAYFVSVNIDKSRAILTQSSSWVMATWSCIEKYAFEK